MLVMFVVLINDYFVYNQEAYVQKYVGPVYSGELAAIAKVEDGLLNSYKILDQEKEIYQVPIERAIDLVVKDYAKK